MSALDAWLARQEAVHVRSVDLGLDRIAVVARALGLRKPAPVVITVAGTNGKGSTVALLEQLLLAAKFSVGTFTSPHLFRYNERIRIDGAEVTDLALIAAFEQIDRTRGDTTLTFFEYNALAAFLILRDAAVDVAVLEVGLGGRLDAVNLIDADAVVVTSIGMDHRDWLGDTLEKIGAEKAGVFRVGAPAVLATADMPSSVYRAASDLGARAVIAGRDYFWSDERDSWSYHGAATSGAAVREPTFEFAALPHPAIEGALQVRNAASALAALESVGSLRITEKLDAEGVSTALLAARVPGRFERTEDQVSGVEWIFDVAHNAPAAHGLAANLKALPRARTIAVVGILADKDAPAIVDLVRDAVDEWILCTLDGPRGLTSSELAARLGALVPSPQLAASVAEGCALARTLAKRGDRVVVFGSFLIVGPALQFLRLY